MSIYISGSLAYDRIMHFSGKFSDHILPEKLHILNVCFLIDKLEERRGGTAGNIAYNLALLGETPLILSTVGKDFDRYAEFLEELGLPSDGIRTMPEEFTAGAYITTDQSNNQITGFNPAAMCHPCGYEFPAAKPTDIAIVSPGNIGDMINLPAKFRTMGMRYIFDPGQQITALSGDQMLSAIQGAHILASNDYELALIMNATKRTKAELLTMCDYIITTMGEEGSLIDNGESIKIGTATPKAVKNPTGAGDAYRAGLLYGIMNGKNIVESAQIGATCSSFCIENVGTQEHIFSLEEFWARYNAAFAK